MVIRDGPVEMHTRMVFESEGENRTKLTGSIDVPSMTEPIDPGPIQQSMRRMKGADRIRDHVGDVIRRMRR
jgi:hypothetical protein